MARDPGQRRRRLLVLGGGPAQLGLLEAAQAAGVWTAVADRDPRAPGFAFADRRCIVSTEDESAIERLAAALDLDGIIAPGTDWPVAVAARVAAKLNLPHPIDPATGILATNKLRQREAFAAAGVPQPPWETVTDGDVTLPVPCVVKAPDRQGQKGLSLVRDASELAPAIAKARAESRNGVALVEGLVDGPEVTVIGYSRDGVYTALAVTDRIVADPPAFGVALAHVWPSQHGGGAAAVAQRGVEALGITNGPTYAQLRIGADGPKIVEIAARLGGGHDGELVFAATGVDLNALALAAAFGDGPEPAISGEGAGGAVTRFLVPPEGTLESVSVPEDLQGVAQVRLYRTPGHRFGPFRYGSDRAGAVLAVGGTRAEALERAEIAADRIRFVTADAGALA